MPSDNQKAPILKDAEIFASGQWPGGNAQGVTFTDSDLDAIVSSFSTLNLSGRVPVKLGHSGLDARTDDSAPALGWIDAIRRVGSKLLADIRLTSEKLVAGIASGAYRFCSVELLRNVQANSRQIPWVLDAVAILGATPPAVGTLKDLQSSLVPMRRAYFTHEGRATFALNGGDQNAELLARVVRAEAAAHRAQLLAPFEAGIMSGAINAAAKDHFMRLHDLSNDEKVLRVTVREAHAFVNDVKELPRYQQQKPANRRSFAAGSGGADDETLPAGDRLTHLCEEYVEEQRVKFGRAMSLIEAAPIIYRRHPELTRAWHEEQQR